jgi:hypothetical protein
VRRHDDKERTMRAARVWAGAAALSVGLAACGGGGSSDTADKPAEDEKGTTTTAGPAPSTSIEGQRVDEVDISPASFSDPTAVTNEHYPVSEVAYVIMLGEEEGESLRIEATLLPDAKPIDWDGGSTDAVVSQFLAFTDGDLAETAYDFFTQDDAGNVWYFGEDVFNYEDGKLKDTEGTWLAGKDGPPGLIMPADPQVGDIYRPENIPDFVFEEVIVTSNTETVDGPSGPIPGTLKVTETLMDGSAEFKNWAPGYGEFRATVPEEEDVVLVFALPNDAQAEPVPTSLVDAQTASAGAFDLAQSGHWNALSTSVEEMMADWESYDAASRDVVPEQFIEEVDTALDDLSTAAEDEHVASAAEAAIDLDLALLDVVMTHGRLPDAQRIAALERRLTLEEAAEDSPAGDDTRLVMAALQERSDSLLSD